MSNLNKSNGFSKMKEFNFLEGGSSKGVLAKCFIEDTTGSYLLKTGSFSKPNFSNLEPVTECICSNIADLLNVTHAVYELMWCICLESDLWKTKEVLVCKTKLFTDKDNYLISGEKLVEEERDYKEIVKILGSSNKLDIDNMIVFDYLVNNTDRHHNNFGILVNLKNRTRILAPLFDHGSSLLSDFDSEYLLYSDFDDVYDECDYSKFFSRSNLSQLRNVSKFKLNLDFDEIKINEIFSRYKGYLPYWRLSIMKEVFNRRLGYVRKSFVKEGEYYVRRNNKE